MRSFTKIGNLRIPTTIYHNLTKRGYSVRQIGMMKLGGKF